MKFEYEANLRLGDAIGRRFGSPANSRDMALRQLHGVFSETCLKPALQTWRDKVGAPTSPRSYVLKC